MYFLQLNFYFQKVKHFNQKYDLQKLTPLAQNIKAKNHWFSKTLKNESFRIFKQSNTSRDFLKYFCRSHVENFKFVKKYFPWFLAILKDTLTLLQPCIKICQEDNFITTLCVAIPEHAIFKWIVYHSPVGYYPVTKI